MKLIKKELCKRRTDASYKLLNRKRQNRPKGVKIEKETDRLGRVKVKAETKTPLNHVIWKSLAIRGDGCIVHGKLTIDSRLCSDL